MLKEMFSFSSSLELSKSSTNITSSLLLLLLSDDKSDELLAVLPRTDFLREFQWRKSLAFQMALLIFFLILGNMILLKLFIFNSSLVLVLSTPCPDKPRTLVPTIDFRNLFGMVLGTAFATSFLFVT